MAITREKKQQIVAGYVENMTDSQAIFIADYRGLSVAQLTDLRRKLREEDGKFQIVKNTLFRLALKEAGIPVPEELLQGPVAASYCTEAPPVAKVLTEYAKGDDALEIKGAIMGANILDAQGVASLASLPPREILLGQLVSAVQGPMSSLVSTITAPMRELAQVLHARSEQGQDAAA